MVKIFVLDNVIAILALDVAINRLVTLGCFVTKSLAIDALMMGSVRYGPVTFILE